MVKHQPIEKYLKTLAVIFLITGAGLAALNNTNSTNETNSTPIYLSNHSIEVYSPSEGKQVLENTDLYVEVQIFDGNFPVKGGTVTAQLGEETKQLKKTEIDTHSGYITTGAEGSKTLTIRYENEKGYIDEELSIEVSGENETKEIYGPKMNVLYPPDSKEIGLNQTLMMEIELIDANGYIINDEEIDYKLLKGNEPVDQGKITQKGYLYSKSHEFTEEGIYKFKLNWKGLERELEVQVGEDEQVPEDERLQVDIVTPQSTSYSSNSDLMAIAIITKTGKVVDNSTVNAVLDADQEFEMDSEGAGEYTTSLGKIDEGKHTLMVTAEHEEETSAKTVDFQVTSNYLEVELTNPKEKEFNVTEEECIEVKTNVTDQNNIIASNAVVVLEVTSTSGDAETRMKQDTETGIYEAKYYPKNTGEYSIEVKAHKSNHVGDSINKELNITVVKEESQVGEFLSGMSLKTLLEVAVAIAILILLLAIATKVF